MQQESARMPEQGGQKTLFQRFAKQIAMGIFCSCIATAIVNFAGIKKIIIYGCSAVVHIFGDPWPGAGGIAKRAEQKVEVALGKAPHIPVVNPLHKTPEQMKLEAEQKEAKRIREEESERRTLHARADLIKFPCDKEWPLEKLRIEVRQAEEEARLAKHKADEEIRKKPLYARFDKIGREADPSLDYKALKEQLEAAEKEVAEDAKFQVKLRQYEKDLEVRNYLVKHGPNACCPNPKCHYLFRTMRKSGEFICPKCRGVDYITRALASKPPYPMPLYPKPHDPNLLDRVKKVLGH